MALCGFNKTMLEALNSFNQELINFGLISRTNKNNETLDQGIKREISDMARLLHESHRISDTGKRLMTEGLVTFVQGFYITTRKNGVEKSKDTIENIGKFFEAMDSKYYGELDGKPEDMKELIKFLDKIEI